MIWVTHATHIQGYELEVGFSDGKVFRIDLANSLAGPIFAPLHSLEQFKKFKVDAELDTLTWENGADFSPEYLYELGAAQADPSERDSAR